MRLRYYDEHRQDNLWFSSEVLACTNVAVQYANCVYPLLNEEKALSTEDSIKRMEKWCLLKILYFLRCTVSPSGI